MAHDASQLLQDLVSNALASNLLPTALFLAERLHALDHLSEAAVYLLAVSLWRNGELHAAIEALRRPVSTSLHNTRGRFNKPACEVSVRCAWAYAQCCNEVGRPREGETMLANVIRTMGAQDLPVPPSTSGPSPASLQVTLAVLAIKAQQPEKAQAYFRAALRECWWCWEAFEGLCALGAPPDVDIVFGASPHPSAAMPLRLQPNGLDAKPSATGGFFTPTDTAPARPTGLQPRFLAGSNLSLDDSYTGSEQSYYALNHASRIRAPAPVGRAFPSLASSAAAGPSSGVFTPDNPDSLASSSTVPAKRSRPRSAASTETPIVIDETRSNGRPLRGSTTTSQAKNPVSNTPSHDASGNVRRSSRLSKERDKGAVTSSDLGLGSSPMKPASTSRQRTTSANTRPTKKSKAATGAASSRSSSVDLPNMMPSDAVSHPGEEWLRSVMRCFGRATACLTRYDCTGVQEAIKLLPAEQRQSWRALMLRGRAEFEGLDYRTAQNTLSMARHVGGQHLIRGTEFYSTLLWHLRKPKELSFLAQDLMAAAPTSAQAWIAAGNVFSHLEDHANALKCFRRATQADPALAYSYTLAGHECVALEEWDRALRFFREALGRDQRHYNAWFGIGNVYLKTGKFRLAEYHFRKAVEINRSNAMLVCAVGSVVEKLGRPKEALEEYERAVSLAPKNPAVRFKRVRMYLLLRKQDAALRDLQWLDGTAPNEFNVHFLLAKLYGIRGDKAQMVLHMTSAQELEPRSAHRIREAIEEAASSKIDEEEGSDSAMGE